MTIVGLRRCQRLELVRSDLRQKFLITRLISSFNLNTPSQYMAMINAGRDTYTHDGTWLGSWFLARNLGSNNKLTVDWPSTSPSPKTMWAMLHVVASNNRKHVFNVHHWRSRILSVGWSPAGQMATIAKLVGPNAGSIEAKMCVELA